MKFQLLRGPLVPLLVLVFSMCLFQLGAALMKSLFPVVGARGASLLRLGIAALVLLLAFRAWRVRLSSAGWWQVARYGAALGLMNMCFYISLRHLPLGIAVALEFTGPLAVALWHSRRLLDFLWVGLVVLGLALLLPFHARAAASGSQVVGAAFALTAALCWALYIVWGRQAGNVAGSRSVALGMAVGALVVLPFGAAPMLPALASPTLLGTAFVVALLSSVVPYTLEMAVLTRLSPRVFGVSMSLEPAIAALSGWLLLGESLALPQYLAIAAIVVASGGAALTARESGH